MAEQTTVPPFSETLLLREIEERKRAERELQQKAHDLGERLKELNCLYTVSALLQETGLPLDEVVRQTVRSLAVAYQYPDIACARATIAGREYRTDNFREMRWKQAADVVVDGTKVGSLDVCYLEERPQWDEGPFLKEERDLLNTVAALLGRSIKERRERDALVRSEARYRAQAAEIEAIYHNAPVGLCILDKDLRFVRINERLAEINGVSAAAHLGKTIYEVLPQLAEQAGPLLRQVLETGEPILGLELSGETPAQPGVQRTWVEHWLPLRDEAGRVVGINHVAEEVTERKRMEDALRQREAELRDAQRVAHVGSWEWDARTDTVTWSEELYRIAGRDPQLPAPNYYTDHAQLYTPASLARLGPTVERALQTGEPYELDLELLRPDGTTRWVVGRGEARRDASGRIVGLHGTALDITERKRMEEALHAAGTYHRSLIEASLDPLVTIGPDGAITDVNAAAEAVTGYARAALIGTDFSDYFTEPAKARAGYQQVFREGAVRDYALEIRHREGRITPVLYNASVYRDEAGKVVGVFAAARDITERRRVEEALRTLNAELERRVVERTAQLEAAVRELEGVSYTVSHDLRAPVRAVDGFAGILLEDYQRVLDAEGTRLLRVIRDNTKKMGRMIDAILDFLRLGRTAMGMTGIDMDELARDVVQELEPMAQGRAVRIEIRPMPPAHGDSAMIHRVMANLVANALKFTRPKETARIEIGGEAGEKENIYYVKDNGVGFDMQYAGKLFGIFQRLHGMDEFEGSGIGLAIVHRIITRHGGRVWAEGKVGEGATFYFALPAT